MSVGRLADPTVSLGSDPRVDPRLPAALAPFGLDGPAPPPPLSGASSRADKLALIAEAEAGFEAMFGTLAAGLPEIDGVLRETVMVPSAHGGPKIQVHVHRPAAAQGQCPILVHLHGGGMAILSAAGPVYARERDELAATGLIVLGVEFRNAAGTLGNHPFPAGLEDCADVARWALEHRAELGGSGVVVSGESGGGNLTLAVSHRARREGWVAELAGFYAQCPFIHGGWASPPDELPSMRENDGYLVGCALFAVLADLYDPDGSHASDPECWPLHASSDQLAEMPPHAISVNELDPLRDEGLAYYRALVRAGVSAYGRIVAGTCHGGDILFPAAIPEVHAASIRDVGAFARAVAG